MQRLVSISLALLLALPRTGQADETPLILTDIPPIHALVRQAVGDGARVELLLSENDGGHHFHLRPKQAELMERADLLIVMGEMLTHGLPKAYRDLNPQGQGLYLDEKMRELGEEIAGDPHYWLSPKRVEALDALIRDQLKTALPDIELDEGAVEREGFALAPARPVFAHNAFSYLMHDYGGEEAEAGDGPRSIGSLRNTHELPISAKERRALTLRLKEEGADCLMGGAGEISNEDREFAKAFGLEIVEIDLLGWNALEGEDYFSEYFDAIKTAFEDCAG